MRSGEPSLTARAAAAHRAAHQVLEQGSIFLDPLALPILGESADTVRREAEARPHASRMRYFIAIRTRFAEDALAAAFSRGTRQLVILGAGLDTYAYRGKLAPLLTMFEVDHPATQAWKRQRLAQAEIGIPGSLRFAPMDFVQDTLADGLHAAGFDPAIPTFFTWLGVVPYLTEDAVFSTLHFIANLEGGAEVVFDYSDPPDTLTPELRAMHDQRAARVAAIGETWRTYFEPDHLREKLAGLGFGDIEDLGPPEIAARYNPSRTTPIPARGGHVLRCGTG